MNWRQRMQHGWWLNGVLVWAFILFTPHSSHAQIIQELESGLARTVQAGTLAIGLTEERPSVIISISQVSVNFHYKRLVPIGMPWIMLAPCIAMGWGQTQSGVDMTGYDVRVSAIDESGSRKVGQIDSGDCAIAFSMYLSGYSDKAVRYLFRQTTIN